MNRTVEKLRENLKKYVLSEKIPVDVFFTGSVARNEERKNNGEKISDIDIIIIIQNSKQLLKVKTKMQMFMLECQKINREITFIFCLYSNLLRNSVADFALNIDFENPIVIMLNKDYRMIGCNKQRFMFQMQSAVYYYSKYILKKDPACLFKSYLNQLRCYMFAFGYEKRTCYINNQDLIQSSDIFQKYVDEKTLINIVECLQSGINIDFSLLLEIENKCKEMFVMLCQIFSDNRFSFKLNSVRYFLQNKNTFIYNPNTIIAQKFIDKVNKENLGFSMSKALLKY